MEQNLHYDLLKANLNNSVKNIIWDLVKYASINIIYTELRYVFSMAIQPYMYTCSSLQAVAHH